MEANAVVCLLGEFMNYFGADTKSRFAFSATFDSRKFYDTYKDADCFNNIHNIRLILAKTNELKKQYDAKWNVREIPIAGMFLRPNVPLVLKKSATVDEKDVNPDDFTLRRLVGLAAAIVFERQSQFVDIYADDSEHYNLQKPYYEDINDGSGKVVFQKFKEYLAAVHGAELFIDRFDYYPFLMALKKFDLKHINDPLLISIGNIRYPDTQEPIAARCYQCYEEADKVAREYYGFELKKVLEKAPKQIQIHFWPVKLDHISSNAGIKIKLL